MAKAVIVAVFFFFLLSFSGFRCWTQNAETTDGDLLNIKRIKYVNVSFILKLRTKAVLINIADLAKISHLNTIQSRPQNLIG